MQLKCIIEASDRSDGGLREEICDFYGRNLPVAGDRIAQPDATWRVYWRLFEMDGTMTLGVEETVKETVKP